MKVSDEQIERTLVALRRHRPADVRDAPGPPRATPEVPPVVAHVHVALGSIPGVRADEVVRVRSRIASGDGPSVAELARHVVGRLVCDRLR